ncbi:MAG TPA: decarboxylating 6-phosphogluconate dehydrogenase [Acidimicrobiales bacterium]|nr:decarboxylating 6-phosphogluconate dehydrogenase [Acidimicrobiales bacterium]
MQLGMVGLGRMGSNLVRRLTQAGHDCVVYDVSRDAVAALASQGASGASSLEDLVTKLSPPRGIWMMLPAAVTGTTVETLSGLVAADDTLIDGGNSYYRDDIDRAEVLAVKHVHYVDVGTSGGVWGLERGFCLMIGGERDIVARFRPIFTALAPGVAAASRTPGRSGEPSTAEQGWLYCGPNGAGHFVKMVHNGIEYALMAAYAEGLNILQNANIGGGSRSADAETAPLRDAKYYRFVLDLAEVSEVWRRGSVIASWLLDLTAEALWADPDLAQFEGRVSDSGEGRWTSLAAIDEGVPATLLTAALYARFGSQGAALFADRVQSAQRRGFGGHEEMRQ